MAHYLAAYFLACTCVFACGFSWHIENINDWSDCQQYHEVETVHGRL
jgi:hypothetical protein